MLLQAESDSDKRSWDSFLVETLEQQVSSSGGSCINYLQLENENHNHKYCIFTHYAQEYIYTGWDKNLRNIGIN